MAEDFASMEHIEWNNLTKCVFNVKLQENLGAYTPWFGILRTLYVSGNDGCNAIQIWLLFLGTCVTSVISGPTTFGFLTSMFNHLRNKFYTLHPQITALLEGNFYSCVENVMLVLDPFLFLISRHGWGLLSKIDFRCRICHKTFCTSNKKNFEILKWGALNFLHIRKSRVVEWPNFLFIGFWKVILKFSYSVTFAEDGTVAGIRFEECVISLIIEVSFFVYYTLVLKYDKKLQQQKAQKCLDACICAALLHTLV